MPQTENRQTEIAMLADQLERSFRGGAWHGPAVSEALAGVGAAAAAARPIPSAHSIWELTRHLTTWIDVARRRAGGEVPEVAPEEDWPPTSGADEAAWTETLDALDEAHRKLLATLLDLDDGRLADPVAGSDPTLRGLLLGIVQHNTYHAGQIVLLKKAAAGGAAR